MAVVVKKIVFKKSRQKNLPNPSHGRVGWVGGIIYAKNIIKKKECVYFFLLALGWPENINKKKYMGDGVKDGFILVLLLVAGL